MSNLPEGVHLSRWAHYVKIIDGEVGGVVQ